MSYLGKVELKSSNIKRWTGTPGAVATITFGTIGFNPFNEQATWITINGVKQHDSAYTLSANSIDFSATLDAADEVEVISIIDIGQPMQPADNTVGITQLKTSDGTSGQVLTTDGSGTLSFSAKSTETLLSMGVTATSAELNHVDGVTSDIQTQIDGKLAPDGDGSALINLPPSGGVVTAVADGALSNGDKVVLQSDGTVKLISGSSVSQSIPSGSATEFLNTNAEWIHIAIDPNQASKMIVVFQDNASSSYGTAVVGTISGTTITFGSEYVFESAASQRIQVAFDSQTAGKFAIAYRDDGNSDQGTVIIGTISGTAITFGSSVVFSASAVTWIGIGADEFTADRYIIGWRESSTDSRAVVCTVSGTVPSFGTSVQFWAGDMGAVSIRMDKKTENKFVVLGNGWDSTNSGRAWVGTISGTTITFGSESNYNSDAAAVHSDFCYDPRTADKIYVCFADSNNSNYGTAQVGTISGTTITWGTSSIYNSGTSYDNQISADPNQDGKSVIVYKDNSDNGGYGNLVVGTISGTTITYGSEINFHAGPTTNYSSVDFATNAADAGKFVVAYRTDAGSSVYTGKAILGQVGSLTTNLTATNFLGISDGTYADTATATIQITGSTNDGQSGLTIGSTYYAQTDGTLSVTADDPGVKVGKAISATELLINTLGPLPSVDGSALTGVDSLPTQTSQSGKFLTTDGSDSSWGTISSGGWQLLSTISASAAGTVDMETTLDSTYDEYMIVGSGIYCSSASDLRFRLKIGGTYITSGYYAGSIRQASLVQTSFDYQLMNNGSSISNTTGWDLSTSSTYPTVLRMLINQPSVSKTQSVYWDAHTIRSTTDAARNISGVGINSTTGVLTGVRLYPFSGNLTGAFRLYGLAKS